MTITSSSNRTQREPELVGRPVRDEDVDDQGVFVSVARRQPAGVVYETCLVE